MKLFKSIIALAILTPFIYAGSCPDSGGKHHLVRRVTFRNTSEQDVHMYRGTGIVDSSETRVNAGQERDESSDFSFDTADSHAMAFPFSVARPGVLLKTENLNTSHDALNDSHGVVATWDGTSLSLDLIFSE